MSYQYPESGGGWQGHGAGPGHYGGPGSYYGGGYVPPPPPYTDPYAAPPDKTSTIWALIVSIVTVVLCCATNIIGIVFAAMALSKDHEPAGMERLTRWSWISTGIHIALGVVLIVVYFGMMAWADSQGY